MNTFTAPQNAQVINIIGDIKLESSNKSTLTNGDKIKAGDQLSLARGSEIVLILEDGTQQIFYAESDGTIQTTYADSDEIVSVTEKATDDVLNDIEAIQALIESGEDVIDLPATAAGGTSNEGSDFITVDRSGNETIAQAGYDTTATAPAAVDTSTRSGARG